MATTLGRIAGTKADAERHAIARTAVLQQLVTDPRVAPVLEGLVRRFGIVAVREEHMEATAALRAAVGELLGSDKGPVDRGVWGRLPQEHREHLLALTDRHNKALKKYRTAAPKFGRAVGKALLPLFRDTLELTPDLGHDLLTYFVGAVLGAEHPPKMRVIVPAPRLTLRFETREDESCDEARARLVAVCRNAVDAIDEHSKQAEGVGRSPSTRAAEAKIVRNAVCFYRAVLRGETISDLAREYKEHRQTIQRGIAETRRLLFDLPTSTFRKPKRSPQK